ncbi:MAG: ATPase [Lachnospiraceae bacterium]|nr:ATPase [Lachnospiraceae bacterium]
MTTEEKLKHFLDTCMEDVRTRSSRMLDEYTSALEQSFEDHKRDAKHRAQLQIRQETERIERDINRQVSAGQLDIRRALGRRQEELKEELFAGLKERLKDYIKSPEYTLFLERQIENAIALAEGQSLSIYLDPSDEAKINTFASRYPEVEFKISSYSFLGGTRAVIPSHNILIDNSLETRLAEEKERFHFERRDN